MSEPESITVDEYGLMVEPTWMHTAQAHSPRQFCIRGDDYESIVFIYERDWPALVAALRQLGVIPEATPTEAAVIAAAERWHDQAEKWDTFDGDAFDYTPGSETACDALFTAVEALRAAR